MRDGWGGGLQPSTIEWWIEKEKKKRILTEEQLSDVRELVPRCDIYWRNLKSKEAEEKGKRANAEG